MTDDEITLRQLVEVAMEAYEFNGIPSPGRPYYASNAS